jgi:hypothetical protein
MIFVGEANGADKAVQQHLASRGYRQVTVYSMEQCRNNLGNWPARHVATPPGRTGFAYYAAKDLAMARDAKCGMMLWDGKSKGTLNNIQQIIGAGKKALVYLAPEKPFYKVSTEQDLQDLLQRCDGSPSGKPTCKSGRSSLWRISRRCTRLAIRAAAQCDGTDLGTSSLIP